MNKEYITDPFERIDTLIEKQKADIEDIRKKINDYKDREKKALGKLEALEHQRIIEIVEYSSITPEMLKQLMLAAKAENSVVNATKTIKTNSDERKEVPINEDEVD